MEWVEVRGRTVEQAVEVALAELGVGREDAEVEVIQEPERGFLGFGGRDAVVRVKQVPKRSRRRRRGGRGRRKGEKGDRVDKETPERSTPTGGSKGKPSGERSSRQPRPERSRRAASPPAREEEVTHGEAQVDIEEQRRVIQEVLEGLVSAFGLEGTVETEAGDDFIAARIVGEQTEALIGSKGTVMQAILELTRTIVQRQTQAGARIRLDIAGYMERRREALRIYAARLAEQVLEDAGEIMLEPMNAADRKVVHDVIAETDGVRSFSEGEEPERSVVIAPDE
jgi:spoIIIJ-associated protein